MSWQSGSWQNRAPIAVNNNGGASTIDVTCTLPQQWAEFWDSVRSDGHDIRITDSDGVTALTWQRQTWNHGGKNAVIQIDAWSPASADATVIAWIYWNHTGTPSDDSGSFTASSAKTGTVINYIPPPGATVVQCSPLPTDSAVPLARYSWPPNQAGYIWWDLRGVLAAHGEPYQGHSQAEEVSAIVVQTNNDGSGYASGNTPANTAMIERRGRVFVAMWLLAGVNTADYIDQITITTTAGRSLIFAAVRVANTPQE